MRDLPESQANWGGLLYLLPLLSLGGEDEAFLPRTELGDLLPVDMWTHSSKILTLND